MIEAKGTVEEYIEYCRFQNRLSPHTLRAYRSDLIKLICYSDVLGNDLSEIKANRLIELWTSKYQSRTVSRYISSAKLFYDYLIEKGVVDINPFSRIKLRLRRETKLPRVIPKEDLCILIEHARKRVHDADTLSRMRLATRNLAVIECLFATGIRVGELCNIRLNEIDLDEGMIKIHGKGRKERVISICNDEVIESVIRYLSLYDERSDFDRYLFLSNCERRLSEQAVRGFINEYARESGIESKITPHMFRHSFATYLLDEDVDIRYIQEFLGHSSISTTEIYTHVSLSRQKEILSQKHPRNKLNVRKLDQNTNDNQ